MKKSGAGGKYILANNDLNILQYSEITFNLEISMNKSKTDIRIFIYVYVNIYR